MSTNEHDPLTAAIIRAGCRLSDDEGYWFGDDLATPTADGPFVRYIRAEIEPLLNTLVFKDARIAALRAELAALESEP